MEDQGKTMRPIPKNVRQIGERDDDVKLYIEDYVNTFIRKCAKADKLILGALIGDYIMQDGKGYLFVEGAVQADGYQIADGRICMTDEAWSSLYGRLETFFPGHGICGWFICSGEAETGNVGMIRGFMYENIGQDKRALIIHNTEMEEERFSVYDENFIREQRGYYLFYERNEAMQSYMVTTRFAARTDPVAVDAVTTQVRTRMVEKKELPEPKKSSFPTASAAALIIGVAALASAIVMMNHYDQLRSMETALTGLVGNFLSSQGNPGAEKESTQAETSGGLIIEDVNSGVRPTESSAPEQSSGGSEETYSGEDESGRSSDGTLPESESQQQEVQDPSQQEPQGPSQSASQNPPQPAPEGTAAPEPPTQEPVTEPATEANAPEYRTYLVERGDTLVTICWSIYGYRDDDIIEKICEINNLIDKDHIYAGQELLIP